MPAIIYVHVIDIDINRHTIKRMKCIEEAIYFVDSFSVFNRNVVVFASRYDEILAVKSSVYLSNTFIPEVRFDKLAKENRSKFLRKNDFRTKV